MLSWKNNCFTELKTMCTMETFLVSLQTKKCLRYFSAGKTYNHCSNLKYIIFLIIRTQIRLRSCYNRENINPFSDRTFISMATTVYLVSPSPNLFGHMREKSDKGFRGQGKVLYQTTTYPFLLHDQPYHLL